MVKALRTTIWLHAALTVAHGAAHAMARVRLSNSQLAFVIAVIVIGPLAALVLLHRSHNRAGLCTAAATMSASFVFGLVNHFVLHGPDHVRSVEGTFGPLFTATAVALAIVEVAGTAFALRGLSPKETFI